jgi:hypothetical protein
VGEVSCIMRSGLAACCDLPFASLLNKSSGKTRIGSEIKRSGPESFVATRIRLFTGFTARFGNRHARKVAFAPGKQPLRIDQTGTHRHIRDLSCNGDLERAEELWSWLVLFLTAENKLLSRRFGSCLLANISRCTRQGASWWSECVSSGVASEVVRSKDKEDRPE